MRCDGALRCSIVRSTDVGASRDAKRFAAAGAAELAWSLVGLQLMGLMTARELIARGIDPLQWSPAQTRDLIRQTMQCRSRRTLGAAGWKNKLAACLKDDYVRTGSKKSRDWPDRKRERPPGPPKIRIASEKEILQAQRLS